MEGRKKGKSMDLFPEKLSLQILQSKMKCDPEGYESELVLLYSQFKSSLELFQQQASLNFSSIGGIGSDPTVAKDLGDRAMFLAHVTPFYPNHLIEFPKQLANLLNLSARSLPSGLRCRIAQALVLLINRKMVDIGENLAMFMELQTLGDRNLKKLAFAHVIHSIKRLNQKHKNESKNRALQNILFTMLQQEDEAKAKRSLVTLCELHRRKVWFDDRTANAICTACFHSSSRIMIAAISFLLDYEKIEDGEDDSDGASSEDDMASHTPQVVLSKESVYKAHHKGTSASKKKKKAKLQRAVRSMKRQQRISSEKNNSNYYSPLNHLKDAQGFAEKLFSRMQACNERFEVRMMMLKVVARTVGLHRLILLNFYPFLQKYVQPHQRDITSLLAAAVQTCHDMVPPDAVEPLFKQIVNQFVHDRSRTEAIAVGLNVVREICLRMPLLMTEELLQDLALYKKSHEKAVSIAARSLIGLFREICPSLLVKKDRGRPTDPKARPKEYGEVTVPCDIPGIELLQHNDDDGDSNDDIDNNKNEADSDDDVDEMVNSSDDEENQTFGDSGTDDDDELMEEDDSEDEDDDFNNSMGDHESLRDSSEELSEVEEENEDSNVEHEAEYEKEDVLDKIIETGSMDTGTNSQDSTLKKRKRSDFDQQLIAADTSFRALKKIAGTKLEQSLLQKKKLEQSSESDDGILSNEQFKKLKELKAKQNAQIALTQHGLLRKGTDAKSTTFKIPNTDELSMKRVDPAKLEVHIRRKLSKEERLALVKAGREDRGKYQARAAVKQKKTGGSSNRQKEHKKAMPLAAKRSKVAKSRVDKKRKNQNSGKQFRGKKAWK